MFKKLSVVIAVGITCLMMTLNTRGIKGSNNWWNILPSVTLNELLRYSFDVGEIDTVIDLYDSNDECNYILIMQEDEGYMIFSKITLEYIEFSKVGKSPYYGISNKLLYFGPGSYAYQNEDGDFYLIIEDTYLDESSLELLQDGIDDINAEALNSLYENIESSSSVNALTSSSSEVWLPYPGFYRKMASIPVNKNSCGYIATGMLLSYFDTYYDDRILDESHTNTNHATREMITSQVAPSQDILDSFVSQLIYLHEGRWPQYGSNDTYPVARDEGDDLINEYLNYYGYTGNYTISSEKSRWFFDEIAYVKGKLAQGYPVMAFIRTSSFFNFVGHVVVCYGYADGGMICHMGYDGRTDLQEVNIKSYTLDQVTTFEYNFSNPHVHSDNYYEISKHKFYCPCGYDIVKHGSDYEMWPGNPSQNSYSTTHNFTCACIPGRTFFEPHVLTTTRENSYTHYGLCACGYRGSSVPHDLTYKDAGVLYHNESCGCGYSAKTSHNMPSTYTTDSYKHYRACGCGKAESGVHILAPYGNVVRCEVCGYIQLIVPWKIQLLK